MAAIAIINHELSLSVDQALMNLHARVTNIESFMKTLQAATITHEATSADVKGVVHQETRQAVMSDDAPLDMSDATTLELEDAAQSSSHEEEKAIMSNAQSMSDSIRPETGTSASCEECSNQEREIVRLREIQERLEAALEKKEISFNKMEQKMNQLDSEYKTLQSTIVHMEHSNRKLKFEKEQAVTHATEWQTKYRDVKKTYDDFCNKQKQSMQTLLDEYAKLKKTRQEI
jgi:chromosome segregation ATPase